jgi:inorganic pyrophosphatase
VLSQIAHFFAHYKDLEPGKWVEIVGWASVKDANAEIMAGVKRYKETKKKPMF